VVQDDLCRGFGGGVPVKVNAMPSPLPEFLLGSSRVVEPQPSRQELLEFPPGLLIPVETRCRSAHRLETLSAKALSSPA
jgi:hypothetical protein